MATFIKIFISSSVKFKNLRKDVCLFFNTKNIIYLGKIFFEVVVFEDFDNPFTKGGSQKLYNDAIKTCNYLLLFYSDRIGKYTKEELLTAIDASVPSYIYKIFDNSNIDTINQDESTVKFLNFLAERYYFQETAENIDDLLIKFYNNIERNNISPLLDIINDTKIEPSSYDKLKSKINRNDEIFLFDKIITIEDENKNNNIIFVHYQSIADDYPHALNFRFSQIESPSDFIKYQNELFITVNEEVISFEFDDETLNERMIYMIAEKLFNTKIFSFNQLCSKFQKSTSKYIFIPFLINHSLETTDKERMRFINNFFYLFSNELKKANLKDKKIIIIFNLQRNINLKEIDNTTLKKLYTKLNFLDKKNYLGKLNPIEGKEVLSWISENFNSNPTVAGQYFETFFSKPFPKLMAKVLQESENLIKENTNKKL